MHRYYSIKVKTMPKMAHVKRQSKVVPMALTAPQDEPDSEDERFVFKRRKKNREKQAKGRALLKTDPNRI